MMPTAVARTWGMSSTTRTATLLFGMVQLLNATLMIERGLFGLTVWPASVGLKPTASPKRRASLKPKLEAYMTPYAVSRCSLSLTRSRYRATTLPRAKSGRPDRTLAAMRI